MAHLEAVDKALSLRSAVLVGFVQRDSGEVTALSLTLLLYYILQQRQDRAKIITRSRLKVHSKVEM